ncbi:MAG: hypothetical protein NZ553_15520 [Caldilinea sp.]|nr:hypothetical protein [Caldilinea sp.]MDW8441884.1 hypothetical protein [Caldilineaceae bacterium]
MQLLSFAELLTVWEENWRRPPLWQGLALLAAACPEETTESLMQEPLGRFNARLWTFRLWCFGSPLTAVTDCLGCGEKVEVTLDVASLCAGAEAQSAVEWQEIATDAGAVRFRLPALSDLLAAGEAASFEEATQRLIQRCVEPSSALSGDVLAILSTKMEEADPLALLELHGQCPQCGQAWMGFLDAASFVWGELRTWAERTLQEVHLLARAYGWREQEILALSPTRRQAYLRMIYG